MLKAAILFVLWSFLFATESFGFKTFVIFQPETKIEVSAKESGEYRIIVGPERRTQVFSGYFCNKITKPRTKIGQDRIGEFKELKFRCPLEKRDGSIRTYKNKAVILFEVQYDLESENPDYIAELNIGFNNFSVLSYRGLWDYEFGNKSPAKDSPFVFFDRSGETLIVSAASNFIIAEQELYGGHLITFGINNGIKKLPDEFGHKWILVFGNGINQTLELWGKTLTDLSGKIRPASDADILLEKISYWTNAPYDEKRYYYHFEKELGYEGTLLAVKEYFDSLGITLGSMQLDSWHYPKGDPSVWTAKNPSWGQGGRGIYKLEGDRNLFSRGLDVFQKELGLPLITHARWWDEKSPERLKYKFSGNVPIDERYWDALAERLAGDGVRVYIQDWLSDRASTGINAEDPDKFFDSMALVLDKKGLTIQYCMPKPSHFMQSSKYSNVTTIRVSEDGFDRKNWDDFLYHSALAGALGIWPFSDNVFSKNTKNLLLATLSAGPVGLADMIGRADRENILKAARPDGVIVKPDKPIVPADETYFAESEKKDSPMVAFTHTKHELGKTIYVFVYSRSDKEVLIKFNPAKLGAPKNSRVYVYDYFKKTGKIWPDSSINYTAKVDAGGSYFIITPVSKSGVAVLGDENKFVSAGKKRILHIKQASDGSVLVGVSFADGEKEVVIYGYSDAKPEAETFRGKINTANYDAANKLLRLSVAPEKGQAEIKIKNKN